MIRALIFYAVTSGRNQLTKRVKDTRYILGLALAAAYFFWVFSRVRRGGGSSGDQPSVVVPLFSVLLVILTVFTWWLPMEDHPLALKKGERQALIPSPLSSRQLLLFKVGLIQPQLLWNAAIVGFLLRSGVSPNFFVRAGAAYLALLALYLQRVAAALVRSPNSAVRSPQRTAVLGVVRTWLLIAVVVVLGQIASMMAGHGVLQLYGLTGLVAALSTPPWTGVTWPFQAMIAPVYARTSAQLLSSFGMALLVVAVETALVFQARPDWTQVGLARTREEKRAARRLKRSAPSVSGSFWERLVFGSFRGRASALLWKNLVSATRTQPLSPQIVMVIGIPVLLGITVLPAFRHLTAFASGMSAAWVSLLLFAGPQFVRNDLRLDLPRLRLLRTYPLTNAEICIAEVGSSAVVLTALQLVMLVLSTVALLFNPVIPLPPGRKVVIAVAVACLLPGMNAINVSAQNIFAVLFPKWVTLGTARPSRTANPGQYYITMLISIGLFVASMLLPAIGAFGIAYELLPLGNAVATLGAAIVAGAIALGEAALALQAMATLLERVDPAAIARS